MAENVGIDGGDVCRKGRWVRDRAIRQDRLDGSKLGSTQGIAFDSAVKARSTESAGEHLEQLEAPGQRRETQRFRLAMALLRKGPVASPYAGQG